MANITGKVTGPAGRKKALLLEAIQKALEDAPQPPEGTDIQNFRLVSVEFEHGGFVQSTTTRVTLDVQPGPLTR